MAEKLTRLTHQISIQLHLVAESYTICWRDDWGDRVGADKILWWIEVLSKM